MFVKFVIQTWVKLSFLTWFISNLGSIALINLHRFDINHIWFNKNYMIFIENYHFKSCLIIFQPEDICMPIEFIFGTKIFNPVLCPHLWWRNLALLPTFKLYHCAMLHWEINFFCCSIESVFLSRAVDPGELLMDLGFGGAPSAAFSRIPSRFFASKSNVS